MSKKTVLKRAQVMLSPETIEVLEIKAEDQYTSVSTICRRIIEEYINNNG